MSYYPTEDAEKALREEHDKRLLELNPLIETCDQGHKYIKLSDHPKRHGSPLCPYCLAIGFKKRLTEEGLDPGD